MANVKDGATGTVLTAPSPATSGLSLVLNSGEGARFPTAPFYVIAHPNNTIPTISTSEKLLVTAVSTDTLTIVRAQGIYTAKSIAVGWRISNAIFQDDLNNASIISNEVPGGLVNSSNTVYTIASAAGRVTGSLKVYKNGARMKGGGIDFTETSTGFTMASAPASGAILLVDYIVAGALENVGTNSLITDEVPTGSINSSNTVFTAARAYIAGSLEVFVNGVKQRRGTHFTETTPSTGTLTMSDAPLAGDDVMINYAFNLNPSGNSDTVDGYHADDLMPVGSLIMYAGDTTPSANWAFCYGQAVSRSTYSTLFGRIGTTYGVGDGSTTFNLPDLRGRVAAGQDDMGGSSANRLTNPGSTGGMDGDVLGGTGGQEAHTPTLAETAAHTHKMYPAGSDGNLLAGGSGGSAANLTQGGGSFRVYSNVDGGSSGSGTAFNIVQPTIILNYIMKIA